jgi:hypothetical protein
VGGWSTPRPGRFTPEKEIWYPFYIRLVGLHGQSGWVRKSYPTRIRSLYSTKHFVARQLQDDPFLPSYCNTQRCYIVDSYVYINNTKGTRYCVSMATIVTWTRFIVTLYVPCLSCCVYVTLTVKCIFKVQGFMLVNQCYCAFEPFAMRARTLQWIWFLLFELSFSYVYIWKLSFLLVPH